MQATEDPELIWNPFRKEALLGVRAKHSVIILATEAQFFCRTLRPYRYRYFTDGIWSYSHFRMGEP
ncbi:hypothetical protein H6F93_03185 [Leptolyngbya sp. FACHB-671]|uniref:hypothetical protein n=1 Tax=Leptolyngbya sp. FACHB-671 TaxID=2692812 RepID=UPI0016884E90|nr:hypothetical protein [Leptolyngbya sp. FACHB-671]MBD2066533.1 hypothetical protein [Leptolyngbya sp. FACHB-671]